MVEPAKQTVFTGTPASGSIAIGTLALLDVQTRSQRHAGTADEEQALLKQALAASSASLGQIIADEGNLAGEILEFQLALIEDDDLIDPVFDLIATGKPADIAFSEILNAEIAEYKSADDEYMAARADDLSDLLNRVLAAIHGDDGSGVELPEGSILVSDELTPSQFLAQDWSRLAGAAITSGSSTSHVAILARAGNVNLIVGLKADLNQLQNGTKAVLDATAGSLTINPGAECISWASQQIAIAEKQQQLAEKYAEKPAIMASGEQVTVYLNADNPDSLQQLSPEICDGIGLVRTEFLFENGNLPDEDQQFATYKAIVEWAAGRPVTMRTLDAGGDKPIAGVTIDGESNPFLGVRGVRLSLLNKELLKVQLRAMLRASRLGPVKIMVPMLTIPAELDEVRSLLEQVASELNMDEMPQLGMMVEVPAAALMAQDFNADFYSIGSNDLIQYTNAVGRDNPSLSYLTNPPGEAVFKLIAMTVAAGRKRGVEVSLCGDMASRAEQLSGLLATGLRVISCAPAQIGRVKQEISRYQPADE